MKHATQIGTLVLALSGSACSGGGIAGADAASDAPPDASAVDATHVDSYAASDSAQIDTGFDALSRDAAPDATPPRPWTTIPTIVGAAGAVATGVPGPIFPFSVLADRGRVFVVGEARSDMSWGDRTFPFGGYVLALDATTNALVFHRSLGPSVSVTDIARAGPDYVIVGTFTHPTTFARTAGEAITLTSAGGTDGFVARMTAEGDFVWATSFGSSTYDNAFSVHVGARGILVVGGLRGTWTGCGAALSPFPGSIDPIEGRVFGNQDALLARFDDTGHCVDATILGRAGTDEFAFDVDATDDAIFVSGQGGGAMAQRSTVDATRTIGGEAGGWLVRLGDDRSHDIWTVSGRGARGRALEIEGSEVYFSFSAGGLELRHDDDIVRERLDEGVGVMRLSLLDGSITTTSLGARSLDTVDLAISRAGVVIPVDGHDPSHAVVGLLQQDSLSTFRNDVVSPYPYVVSADGGTLWMAGAIGGGRATLGASDVEIPIHPNGGFFLARFELSL